MLLRLGLTMKISASGCGSLFCYIGDRRFLCRQICLSQETGVSVKKVFELIWNNLLLFPRVS